VPIQKSSKFNNIFITNGLYTSKHTYSTLSYNPLKTDDNNHVKFYDNAFDMKKNILNENKGKSGIYMLTNKITKKIYIGQSSNLSNSYIKSKANLIICRTLVEYGYSNFSLTILEYCDKFELLTREQFYINKLNPEYNILKIAGNSPNSKDSEYTKAKFNKSLKGVYVKAKSALSGILTTEETRKLMRIKKLGGTNSLFGKTNSANSKELITKKALSRKHSEDTKLKMSAISGNPVNIYEKLSSKGFKLIGSFVSARRAAKFLDISGSTVIKYMNSGEIFKDRYKFSSK
jgi:group I intron endonuclease